MGADLEDAIRAHHDAGRWQGRDRHRRDGVALSQVSELVARVRTQTLTFLRTEAKDRFAELRAELSPEEQQLLVLRVKRGLSWNEIATIFDEEVAMEDEAAIKRAAARYRQRFKGVKDRLRKRVAADKVPD